MKQTTLSALAIAFTLTLGAAPREAEAGLCSKLGFSNKCVVRRDIASGAINSSRVKDESLTGADFLNGSLTGADIGDGSLTGADITDGSLAGADLADGAVSFAKLSEDAVYLRTKVVSPVGPADTDNCDELRAALAAITDNTAANPYLLYLEPGTYDCGTTPLAMKPFVGIRGAGQNLTEITGSVPSDATTAVLLAASGSELSHLSVTNTFAGVGISYGLLSLGTDMVVSHVTVTGSGATSQSNGIRISGGTPTLEHVTGIGGGSLISAGILLFGGADVALDSVTGISASSGSSWGLYVTQLGTVVMARNSVFIGNTSGAQVNSNTEANLVSSQFDDGVSVLGTANCVSSYDGTFTELLSDCS